MVLLRIAPHDLKRGFPSRWMRGSARADRGYPVATPAGAVQSVSRSMVAILML